MSTPTGKDPGTPWPVYGGQGGNSQGNPQDSGGSDTPWPVYGTSDTQGEGHSSSGAQPTQPTSPPHYGQQSAGGPPAWPAAPPSPSQGYGSFPGQVPQHNHQGQQASGYGQSGQQSSQQPPQYGQHTPYYGQYAPSDGQGGYPYGPPAGQQGYPSPYPGGPYQTGAAIPGGTPPSRTGPIWVIVAGVFLMLVVAPITFLGLIFNGFDLTSLTDESLTATNGGSIQVDETGTVGIATSTDVPVSCTIENDATDPVTLTQEMDGVLLVARGLEPGEYTLSCPNLPAGTTIIVVSGTTMGQVVPSTMTAFGWSSVVGVIGLATTIGGIVWLINRNKARRAFYQGPRG